MVLLPYKFTLLSNLIATENLGFLFYYPINLHYSQTREPDIDMIKKFYYPINLHYSQTLGVITLYRRKFYYPINLHYSQTSCFILRVHRLFYYPINLHYSQTSNLEKRHYSPCIYRVETIIIISHF